MPVYAWLNKAMYSVQCTMYKYPVATRILVKMRALLLARKFVSWNFEVVGRVSGVFRLPTLDVRRRHSFELGSVVFRHFAMPFSDSQIIHPSIVKDQVR